MAALNAALTAAADVVLAPLRGVPPLAGVALVSLVTAIAMLMVFKRASDQARLAAVKRSIHAALFEIRLFQDDLRAILRAQVEILRHNATYLRLTFAPMLWMAVPLLIAAAQLQFFYGYAPLPAGQPLLLKASVRDAAAARISLDTPGELKADTPAVWFPGAGEIVWRIVPAQPGRYEVRVTAGPEAYAKTVQVGGGVVRRSPVRLARGAVSQILYPSEAPLPDDAPVSAISVSYPEARIGFLGFELSWIVWYLLLSLLFALVLRRPFGVAM
jgi:uncharacterized membrane protein (DUF106 family)